MPRYTQPHNKLGASMFRFTLAITACIALMHGNPALAAYDEAKWSGLLKTAEALLQNDQPKLAEDQLRAALSDDMPGDRRIVTQTQLAMALYLQEKYKEVVALATDNLRRIETTHPEMAQDMQTAASILTMSARVVGDPQAFALGQAKMETLRSEMILAAWTTDASTGEMLHHHSGIRFPPSFGSFGSAETTAYRPGGSDVSVSYHGSGPAPGLLTIYVTEMPGTAAQHIREASKSIQITAGNIPPISEGEISIVHDGETITGARKLWEYTARNRELTRGGVMVFARGRYHIKFRVTYPARARDEFEAALNRVLERFPWPATS